jgi:hypothetical protein
MAGERLTLVPRVPRRARRVIPAGTPPPGSKEVLVWEMDDPALPRAVMFHDSFAEPLRPLLAEHFARLACSWQDDFAPAFVERERPQVVLQEMVERLLMVDFAPDAERVTRAWRPR